MLEPFVADAIVARPKMCCQGQVAHGTSRLYHSVLVSTRFTQPRASVCKSHRDLYIIVINQFPRFALPSGFMLLYCIQSKGLVDDYFLAHCFHGYNKHVFSPQELYECLPWPSGTV